MFLNWLCSAVLRSSKMIISVEVTAAPKDCIFFKPMSLLEAAREETASATTCTL